MASKLALPVAIVLATFSLGAQSALALGVQHQRAAGRSNPPVQSVTSLIAPAAACPNQANASVSTEAQQQAKGPSKAPKAAAKPAKKRAR